MARIQFPKSETNFYWDGKEHDITPHRLAQLNDSVYYYMEGYDNNFRIEMMTLLKKADIGFNKVPVDDYYEFKTLVSQSSLGFVSTTLLGDKVGLEPMMTVDQLREQLQTKIK